ncbi:hypothetical protein [Candidatus Accumulibacter vicinus]|uniref:Uncharacterized protein n=1 Tax=Candidatus Accumulibacter vicinus TaxID=2954382 RepID=A0A084XUK3_9PROT|nr:hypothetical protein [Candidatus Accumulibacter vicinus]KFB66147.1 MAG: hypothetical protein CAPSK01_004516 [Candidatus Accumulibacter vicinus]
MARRPAPLIVLRREDYRRVELCNARGEYVYVVEPKTTAERVEKLRQQRADLGLKRRELYAHDDDWPKLQELAAKLQRKRERNAKRAAP